MNVTPQHLKNLQDLESGKSFTTSESPRLLKHYFRDIAIEVTEVSSTFDSRLAKDIEIIDSDTRRQARIFRVQLETGVQIFLTKLKKRFRDKESVRVDQESS